VGLLAKANYTVMVRSKWRWRSVDEQLWQREDARVDAWARKNNNKQPSGNVQK